MFGWQKVHVAGCWVLSFSLCVQKPLSFCLRLPQLSWIPWGGAWGREWARGGPSSARSDPR